MCSQTPCLILKTRFLFTLSSREFQIVIKDSRRWNRTTETIVGKHSPALDVIICTVRLNCRLIYMFHTWVANRKCIYAEVIAHKKYNTSSIVHTNTFIRHTGMVLLSNKEHYERLDLMPPLLVKHQNDTSPSPEKDN